MKLSQVLVFAGGLLLAAGDVYAQRSSPLVGAWERTMLKSSTGQVQQPPLPAAFLILTASGHYSQTAIPAGRTKVDKPLDQMTKEELVACFQYVEARHGTYKVEGNKLTRKNATHTNTAMVSNEQIQLFRIEGDNLILSNLEKVDTATFRRVK